jgi:hypothetical protein
MIARRVQARTDDFGDRVSYLPSRAAALTLPTPHGPIQVIGAYVPSQRCQRRENRTEEEMASRLHRRPRHPQPHAGHGELAHLRMISSAVIYRTLRA